MELDALLPVLQRLQAIEPKYQEAQMKLQDAMVTLEERSQAIVLWQQADERHKVCAATNLSTAPSRIQVATYSRLFRLQIHLRLSPVGSHDSPSIHPGNGCLHSNVSYVAVATGTLVIDLPVPVGCSSVAGDS